VFSSPSAAPVVATQLENMEDPGNLKVTGAKSERMGKVRENVFLPVLCYSVECDRHKIECCAMSIRV